jgi:hypothetical protein
MKASVSLPCLPGIHRVTPPYGRGRINAIFDKKLDKSLIKKHLTESGRLEHSLSTSSTLSRNLSNTMSRSTLPLHDPSRERLEKLSSSSIGSLLPLTGPSRIPAYVEFDKKVLEFSAYYREPVFESSIEKWRNRKLIISYFLNDHTVSIVEQKSDNSGMSGGPFLERSRHIINSGTFERYLEIDDLLPGKEINLYSRRFRIIDVSGYTRNYLTNELGLTVPDGEPMPSDKYTIDRAEFMSRETGCDITKDRGKPMYPMKRYNEALLGKHTRATGAEHRNHLFNGQTLEFTLVWEGSDRLYGHTHVYKMRFYLEDRTVAINNVFKKNSGIDPFAKFYSRARLLKNYDVFKGEMGHENMDGEDDEHYYDVDDFNIGTVLNVNNRKMTIVNCSKFTRNHYITVVGKPLKTNLMALRDLIDPVLPPAPPRPLPPHNGFGSEEDSVSNCKKLIIKPHRKDEKKLVVMEGKTLKFSCRMLNDRPADQDRSKLHYIFIVIAYYVCGHYLPRFNSHSPPLSPSPPLSLPPSLSLSLPPCHTTRTLLPISGFVLRYFLANDTITVYEPPVHNSGYVGGKFIRRMRIKKEGITPTTYYKPDDFFAGAKPIFFGQTFEILSESKGNWQYTCDMDHDTLLNMLLRTMRARGARVTYTFRAVDEDGDGRINFTEFKNALNSLLGLTSGNAIPEIVCAEVFRYFDQSAHGTELEGELSVNEIAAHVQGHGSDGRKHSQLQGLEQYLVTLKRRESEIHKMNNQDMVLRDFVS